MFGVVASRVRSVIAHELQAIAYEDPFGPTLWQNPRRCLIVPFLGIASLAVQFVATARQRLYAAGFLQQARLPVPVISVGNLTWGGNGKTPMAELVARRCWEVHKVVPLILSRGYRGGDESRMIQRRLLGVGNPALVGVGADREEVARKMLKDHPEIGVVVLDDGMQHLRVARDLEICMVNALRPFGNGHILPLGPLRENPEAALARCNVLVVHHADLQSQHALLDLENRLQAAAGPKATLLRSKMQPEYCWSLNPHLEGKVCTAACSSLHVQAGTKQTPTNSDFMDGKAQNGMKKGRKSAMLSCTEIFKGAHVICLTGIGSPQALEKQLKLWGADVVEGAGRMGDHDVASEAILTSVRTRVSSLALSSKTPSPVILMTEKDLDRDVSDSVKANLEGLPAFVLSASLVVFDLSELDECLRSVVRQSIRQRPRA